MCVSAVHTNPSLIARAVSSRARRKVCKRRVVCTHVPTASRQAYCRAFSCSILIRLTFPSFSTSPFVWTGSPSFLIVRKKTIYYLFKFNLHYIDTYLVILRNYRLSRMVVVSLLEKPSCVQGTELLILSMTTLSVHHRACSYIFKYNAHLSERHKLILLRPMMLWCVYIFLIIYFIIVFQIL